MTMVSTTTASPAPTATAKPSPTPSSPLRSPSKKDIANPSSPTPTPTPNRTPNRPRMNSRDIARSYSGMYGQGDDDLLPFELARNWHTDWLERGEFLFVYLGGIAVFQVLVLAVLDTVEVIPLFWSWTVTNAVHCLVSIVYLHWLKGSLFDDQGEMAAMTLWEQLEGRPKTVTVKRALTIVPTLLCYAACHFSSYDYDVCGANIVLWSIHVAAKLPFMNGVRIFGINRTTGIDDYSAKED